MSELEQFLDFLFQDDAGYVYAPKAKRGQSWIEKWYQWPSQRQELIDWISLESMEHDLYVGPQLYKSKKVDKDNIKSCNAVWLEYDGQNIDYRNVPEPDVVIASGTPGHYHCYWKVTKGTPIEAIEEVNRRLTYYLRADASGWDATQVLRPPNSVNHKNGQNTVLERFDVPFSNHLLEEFDSAPVVAERPAAYTPESLLDPGPLLKKLNSNLREKVTKTEVPEGTRSTFLMNLGYAFARLGLEPIEAVSLLVHCDNRIKKFYGRGDVLQRLGEIVAIAYLKHEQETSLQGYSPLEILTHENNLEWVIPGWLHRNGIMLITGQPGVGKTQIALDFGAHIASDTELFGLQIKSGLKVAVLSLEMMLEELNYIFRHHHDGLATEAISSWNSNVRVYPAVDEGTKESYEKMFELFKPNVVIIDSLSELVVEDMKETEARSLMKWLKSMRVKYDHAQILVHHNRKAQSDNKKPNKLSDLYGSFIFGKLSETVLCLWQDEKQSDSSKLELITVKARFATKSTTLLRRNEYLRFEVREPDEQSTSETRDFGGYSGSFGPVEDFTFDLEIG